MHSFHLNELMNSKRWITFYLNSSLPLKTYGESYTLLNLLNKHPKTTIPSHPLNNICSHLRLKLMFTVLHFHIYMQQSLFLKKRGGWVFKSWLRLTFIIKQVPGNNIYTARLLATDVNVTDTVLGNDLNSGCSVAQQVWNAKDHSMLSDHDHECLYTCVN